MKYGMSFLFLFFLFPLFNSSKSHHWKILFPENNNVKFENEKKMVIKYCVFHFVFLRKAKNSSVQVLWWERQAFCKIKFQLIPEISNVWAEKIKMGYSFIILFTKKNMIASLTYFLKRKFFLCRKNALLKTLYWKHIV